MNLPETPSIKSFEIPNLLAMFPRLNRQCVFTTGMEQLTLFDMPMAHSPFRSLIGGARQNGCSDSRRPGKVANAFCGQLHSKRLTRWNRSVLTIECSSDLETAPPVFTVT
jgi:hypothetical protein